MTYFRPKEEEDFFNWHYVRDKTHISFFSEKSLRYISGVVDLEMIYIDEKKTAVFRKK